MFNKIVIRISFLILTMSSLNAEMTYNNYGDSDKIENKKFKPLKNRYIEEFKSKSVIHSTTLSGPITELSIYPFTLKVTTSNGVLYRVVSEDSSSEKQIMPLNNTGKIKIVEMDNTYTVRFGFYDNEWWKSKIYHNGYELMSTDSMRFRYKTIEEAEEFTAFLRYLMQNYK